MRVVFAVTLLVFLPWVIQAQGEECEEKGNKNEPLTAQEVIALNLEAVGGAERIAAVSSLALHGASGSALLPPSEKVTLFLTRPNLYKQVGAFRIVLCDGQRCVVNNGEATEAVTGRAGEGLEYRLGFYHSCFSLLAWKDLFDQAELVGVKEYGSVRQYELRVPKAEDGNDLWVYVDAQTFLIDRLVFSVQQEGAGELKVVNQLRDWTTVDGITMPTRVVFDTIGWETTPTHFVIEGIELDPELEEGLFEDAEIDFGSIVVDEGVVRGEVFGDMDGMILANIREADLEAAGIEVKSWLDLSVGEGETMAVRYLSNIQRSAADIKPGEVYLTTYPISLYPRMMLLGWDMDLTDVIPCTKGDAVVVTVQKVEDREEGEAS